MDSTASLLERQATSDDETAHEIDATYVTPSGNAGTTGTILNMTNNIVGAGLLSLPGCLREASLIPGLLLLCTIAMFSASTFMVLAFLCENTNTFTYRALGDATVGPKFGVFMQVVIMSYTGISCLSYLILCADFIAGETGIATWWCSSSENASEPLNCNPFVKLFTHRWFPILFFTVLFLTPTSMQRNLSALKYTSFLSFIGMCYTMTLTVWYFSSDHSSNFNHEFLSEEEAVLFSQQAQFENQNNSNPGTAATVGGVDMFHLSMDLFAAVPIMNVAFIAQYNAPRYYQELQDRNLAKFAKCVGSALGGCFLVYGTTALFGYLSFKGATGSDILQNFGVDYVPAVVGRLAMTLVVLFTYPLAFHSLRASYTSLFLDPPDDGVINDHNASNSWLPWGSLVTLGLARPSLGTGNQQCRFYSLTLILIIVTVIPALFLSDIGVVLKYKGALFGGLIAYGFPAIMLLSYTKKNKYRILSQIAPRDMELSDENSSNQNEITDQRNKSVVGNVRGFAWFLIGFCVVTGLLSTVVTTAQVLQKL